MWQMSCKLSILIPTIADRRPLLLRLVKSICSQFTYAPHTELYLPSLVHGTFTISFPLDKCNNNAVEIIINYFEKDSIGEKRNCLLNYASGEYVCFIDDDDRIDNDYFKEIFIGIEKGVDCCSLEGIITFDGQNPKHFTHSIQHDSYYEKDDVYYRFPNHLNCIKASIAKQFKFPETNHGEDTDWAHQIHNSGLLKTEHTVTKTIYYYDYITKK